MTSFKLPLVVLIAVWAVEVAWAQQAGQPITTFGACLTPVPGRDVTLYCAGRDLNGTDPSNTLSWSASGNSFPSTIVYGKLVQPNHRNNLSIKYNWSSPHWVYDLTIKDFSAKHNGHYKCEIATWRKDAQLRAVAIKNWDFVSVDDDRLTLNTGTPNDTVKYLALTEVTSKDRSYVHADGESADVSSLPAGVYSAEACFCGDPSESYSSFGCHAVRSLIVDCNADKSETLWSAGVALLVISLLTFVGVFVVIVISYRSRGSSDNKTKNLMHVAAVWVILLLIGTLILAAYASAGRLEYHPNLGDMAPASGPPATGTTIPPAQPAHDNFKEKCDGAENKWKQAVTLGWVAFVFALVAIICLVVYGVVARKRGKGNKESAKAYGEPGDKNGSEGVDDNFLPENVDVGST